MRILLIVALLFSCTGESHDDSVRTEVPDAVSFATQDVVDDFTDDVVDDILEAGHHVPIDKSCVGFTEELLLTCVLYHGDAEPPQCLEVMHPSGCRLFHCEDAADVCWVYSEAGDCSGTIIAAPPVNYSNKWDSIPECAL